MFSAQANVKDCNQFGSNSLVARKCLWYFASCKWVGGAVSLSPPSQRRQSTTASELSDTLQGVCHMCHLTLRRHNSYSWKSSSLPTAVVSKSCFSQEVTTKTKAVTPLLSMKWTKILQIPSWLRMMTIDFISCKQQTWNINIWEKWTELAEASHCEVPETSLCIRFAMKAFPVFSFSRKHFHKGCVLLAQRHKETTTNPHLLVGSVNVCLWHPVWCDTRTPSCPTLGYQSYQNLANMDVDTGTKTVDGSCCCGFSSLKIDNGLTWKWKRIQKRFSYSEFSATQRQLLGLHLQCALH